MAKTAAKKRTYTKCENAAAHRKAQNKYVAKDPAGQRARVKSSEKKHPEKVKARKAKAGKPHKGGPKGRPRTC